MSNENELVGKWRLEFESLYSFITYEKDSSDNYKSRDTSFEWLGYLAGRKAAQVEIEKRNELLDQAKFWMFISIAHKNANETDIRELEQWQRDYRQLLGGLDLLMDDGEKWLKDYQQLKDKKEGG